MPPLKTLERLPTANQIKECGFTWGRSPTWSGSVHLPDLIVSTVGRFPQQYGAGLGCCLSHTLNIPAQSLSTVCSLDLNLSFPGFSFDKLLVVTQIAAFNTVLSELSLTPWSHPP